MSINLIVAIFAICHIVVKMVIYDVFFNSRQRTGLAAVLEFMQVSPEQMLIGKLKLKICKKMIELRPLEPLLIANKKLKILPSASIAANPMLHAVFLCEFDVACIL